jgi:hypothetical protein
MIILNRIKSKYQLVLLLIFSLISIFAISCDCGNVADYRYDLIIENNTNQTLDISTSEKEYVGQVKSGGAIKTYFDTYSANITISAKNTDGEIVFTQTYSILSKKYRLEKIEKYTYKAVISALDSNDPSNVQ